MGSGWQSWRWWLFLVAPLLASCSTDPESFCTSKVEQICTALSGCCTGKSQFDQADCELSMSAECLSRLDIEEVRAGEVVFDEAAANACFSAYESCRSEASEEIPSLEQIKGCGNMLTGHRPPGAACQRSRECEKAGGDFSTCYQDRVCAKVILSEEACGFSLDTNELHQCVPGKQCEKDEASPTPDLSPTEQDLEFTGKCIERPSGQGATCKHDHHCKEGLYCDGAGTQICQPLKDGGQACSAGECKEGFYCDHARMQTCQPLKDEGQTCSAGECKEGFYCDHARMQTCQPLKDEGQACSGNDFESQSNCKEGLYCNTEGTSSVCRVATWDLVAFCYVPAECGDGYCVEGVEDQKTCPDDCGVCGDGACVADEKSSCPWDCGCGDGYCDYNQSEPQSCPADCCGDGFCDPGETITCPADCCGDGFCGSDETTICFVDCCGDGICGPEEAKICSFDCCGDGFCDPDEVGSCVDDCQP